MRKTRQSTRRSILQPPPPEQVTATNEEEVKRVVKLFKDKDAWHFTIEFQDGTTTSIPSDQARRLYPQRLLDYYETITRIVQLD
jgi:hypothetical protein